MQQTTFVLPEDLHRRAKAVAKQLRTTMGQLVRDSLRDKVEQLEAKMREDAQRREEEIADKRVRRTEGRLRRMGAASPLAPKPPSSIEDRLMEAAEAQEAATASASPSLEKSSPLDAVYTEHATRIFAVLDRPHEKRIRIFEAMKAIKDHAPLTCPSDSAILIALERAVLKLRAATPPAPAPPVVLAPESTPSILRTVDDLVGRVVNPQKIQSFGDIAGDDDEKPLPSTKRRPR